MRQQLLFLRSLVDIGDHLPSGDVRTSSGGFLSSSTRKKSTTDRNQTIIRLQARKQLAYAGNKKLCEIL